jgi:branched-chain amino acid transport system substrate-binding protein
MILPLRALSRLILLQLSIAGFTVSAHAQVTADAVRIAALNDQSSVYADFGAPGAIVAARMAVESRQGRVLGRPIEVLIGDHQSKPDIGVAIARQWFDADNVTMAIGFDRPSPKELGLLQSSRDNPRREGISSAGTGRLPTG